MHVQHQTLPAGHLRCCSRLPSKQAHALLDVLQRATLLLQASAHLNLCMLGQNTVLLQYQDWNLPPPMISQAALPMPAPLLR